MAAACEKKNNATFQDIAANIFEICTANDILENTVRKRKVYSISNIAVFDCLTTPL